jgi:eukaryotic translation initiation factor 2C
MSQTNNICYSGSRATKSLSVCTPARYADTLCDRLRCYMQAELKNPQQSGETLDDYRTTPTSWFTHQDPSRANPWHKDLDDVVFYV